MRQITLKERFGRAALVGFAGGAVALAIICSDPAFRHEFGFVRAAAMGAFLAGFALARGFGGQGPWGWFRAGLTFGLATVLGAMIAVPLLGLDGWLMHTDLMRTLGNWAGSALLGPVYVLGLVGDDGLILRVWLAGLILSHGAAIWRLRLR